MKTQNHHCICIIETRCSRLSTKVSLSGWCRKPCVLPGLARQSEDWQASLSTISCWIERAFVLLLLEPWSIELLSVCRGNSRWTMERVDAVECRVSPAGIGKCSASRTTLPVHIMITLTCLSRVSLICRARSDIICAISLKMMLLYMSLIFKSYRSKFGPFFLWSLWEPQCNYEHLTIWDIQYGYVNSVSTAQSCGKDE
jgi:hypothetical protein